LEVTEIVEVLPFVGFGGIRLGMTRESVCNRLGQPEAVDGSDDGDVTLSFGRGTIQCTFYVSDHQLLGSITFFSERFVLQGLQVVGITLERLHELIQQEVLPGASMDNDWPDLDAKSYHCESLGLSLWVHEGIVENVTMYPRYDDTGTTALFPVG
jgi:hypothetical protein